MSRKLYYKRIFHQLLILITGISIALYINDWKQDLQYTKNLRLTFDSINGELEENILNIRQNIPFQDSLDSSVINNQNESNSISNIIMQFGGFKSPVIKYSAWKLILNNSFHRIDYNIISELSEIDKKSKEVEYKTQKLIDFIYDNAEVTTEQRKETLSVMLQDFIIAEEDLISIMEVFLKNKKG